MNATKRNRASKILAITCVFALLVCSLAYFTDRVEMNAKITAGTVGIAEDATNNWTNQLQNADGSLVLDNINPGDSRSLKYTVTNTGNKAVDVRHTIKLSVVDAAGNAKYMTEGLDVNGETMLQFDIFKASDVVKTSEANGNAGYLLKDGAKPVYSSVTKDATTQMGVERALHKDDQDNILSVSYYFADSILDGVGENKETGYAKAQHIATELGENDAVLNAERTAVTYDYVLIFRDTTLNDFQGSTLHAELVIEAKQHLNTKSSWQNIETVDYAMTVSGKDVQNTTIQTAPNNQTGVLETVTDATSGTYNKHTAH